MSKKVFSRRDFLRLGSMAAAGLTLSACAPAQTPAPQAAEATKAPEQPKAEEPTKAPEAPKADVPASNQKFAFWPEWGGKDADALKVQVDKFTAETGIACDFLPIRDHARMVASISAGEPPDLLMTWDSNAVGSWGFQKALLDLGNYITGSKMDLNNFFKIGLDSGNLMGTKQIGLPLTNYLTSLFYYNKDTFQKAGLDPQKPPETWEDLWDASEKMTVVENGQIKQLGYMPLMGQDGHPTLMAYANGGSIWSDDFRKVTPDSEANITGLNWDRQFYAKYGTEALDAWSGSIGTDATLPTFALYAGTAGARTDGEWLPNMIEALDPQPPVTFSYMPYPKAKAEVKGTMTANTNPMVIPTAAKNPDAGFKFIEFISRAENSAPMCVIAGNASPTKDGLTAQIAATKSPTYKMILEQVWAKANVKPLTVNSPVGSEYNDAYSRARDKVVKDGENAENVMKALREEYQPKLDEALANLGI